MFLKIKDGNNWVEIPMIKGDTGATGPAGQDGQDGADGVGVPSGGTQGQVLTKSSSTDYDTAWTTPSSELPAITSGDELKVLTVNNNHTGVEWAYTQTELPSYSIAQDGKVLGVEFGLLTWVTPVTMTDVQNYVNGLDGTNISY